MRELVHVDLADGLESLVSLTPEGPDLYVELWLRGLPLGAFELPREHVVHAATVADLVAETVARAVGDKLLATGFVARPRSRRRRPAGPPPDFKAVMGLRRPLSRLREQTEFAEPERLGARISLVICTRERPQELARLLGSLAALRVKPAETVVVDNAPSSFRTREVVAAASGVRYVLERRPGLGAARNTGLRVTTGDIVAFTDDDTVVHPDWLWRLVCGFNAADVMAVTGLVLPAILETPAELAFELELGGLNHGYRRLRFDREFFADWKSRGVPAWAVGAGASMAFRRDAFQRVGGFDERLGAGAAGCSEDSELWYRLLAEGWSCVYEPSAVVFHHHRREATSLLIQTRSYMRGHLAALFVQFGRYRHGGNLRRALLALPWYFGRRLLMEELLELPPPARTLIAQVDGFLAGLRFAPLSLDHDPPPSVD